MFYISDVLILAGSNVDKFNAMVGYLLYVIEIIAYMLDVSLID